MMPDSKAETGMLIDAICDLVEDADAAVDRIDGSDRDALRLAVEMVRVLRRMLPGMTVRDIHRGFGAPGDFGYETPIGDALARIYGVRGKAKS